MAEDQGNAVDLDLEVGLDALPTLELSRRRRIVVARGEMLAAVQPSKELATTAGRWRMAKSPRCQTTSSGPTVSFHRSIRPSFIAATEANGRR
jgi:hypothetical protein